MTDHRLAHLRAALAFPVAVLIAGCAFLRPVTEGTAGSVAWKTVNLRPSRDSYAFTLVLTETRGVGITYTEVQSHVHHSGSNHLTTLRQGRWRIEPRGELHLSFGAAVACSGCTPRGGPTLWEFVFVGTDDRGDAVRTQFEVRLPVLGRTASPPRPLAAWAS